MGYFSEFHLTMNEQYQDPSAPSFEDQLLWRYEDLKDRFLELFNIDAPFAGNDYFTADDYRYAPIQSFKTIRDICRAIEIAKEDLEIKCNIAVDEDGIKKKHEDEQDPNQTDIWEIVLLPTWFQTAAAAA